MKEPPENPGIQDFVTQNSGFNCIGNGDPRPVSGNLAVMPISHLWLAPDNLVIGSHPDHMSLSPRREQNMRLVIIMLPDSKPGCFTQGAPE